MNAHKIKAQKTEDELSMVEPTLDAEPGMPPALLDLPAEIKKTEDGLSMVEPTLDSEPGMPPALLVLPAEITHAQAASCLRLLLTTARSAASEQTIMVDASLLARFDSSALAVLVECRRQVREAGMCFAVRNMPARLAELARLYGVAELLGPDSA